MKSLYLLGIGLISALAVAACEGNAGSLSNGDPGGAAAAGGDNGTGGSTTTTDGAPAPVNAAGVTPNDGTFNTNPSAPAATNSAAGQKFYVDNVHNTLAANCGTCHDSAGPGPYWITKADAQKTYTQLFSQGYVIRGSRIVLQVAHSTSTTNFLTTAQAQVYNQWVELELADTTKAKIVNPLETLGNCFSQDLFDKMQLGNLRTTQRTANNNTNKVQNWNENADNCTGCRNNTPCATCHSGDPATNFNNAVGNTLLPADTTFQNTKLTNPAYITKFFGVSPDAKPIASDAIKKKSDATQLDHAYTHPMFTMTAAQQTLIDNFVNDAITKYNAGTCTTAAPATPAATPAK